MRERNQNRSVARLKRWWSAHTVTTERLSMRPVRSTDGAAWRAAIDDEVMTSQGWTEGVLGDGWFEQVGDAEARITRRGGSRLARVCPLVMVVTDLEDKVIGSTSIEPGKEPSVGWWLGPNGRGRGLAPEMLELTFDYAHRHLLQKRIHMSTAVTNERNRRLIEAVGGVEHDRSDHRLPNGKVVEAVSYVHVGTAEPDDESWWLPSCRSRAGRHSLR
jgi:RimJ/RimL family protein N-acetyltransferase